MQVEDSRFDENGVILESQWVFLYGFDYMNVFTTVYNAFMTQGMSLPPCTTLIQPPYTELGYAAVFEPTTGKWTVTPDHRGESVYNKKTQQRTTVDYLGAYRDEVTPIKPGSTYESWDYSANNWRSDDEYTATQIKTQQQSKVTDESKRADEMIAICNEQLELSYYNPGETEESVTEQLKLWKLYHLKCQSFLNGSITDMPYAPDSQEYKAQQAIAKAQAEAQAAADLQEELAKEQAEEQAQAAAEQQAAAQAQAAEEAKAKAEAAAAAKAQADADAKAQAQAQADAQAKADAETKAQADAQAKSDDSNTSTK